MDELDTNTPTKGEKGIQGRTGAQGVQGVQGIQGRQGEPGVGINPDIDPELLSQTGRASAIQDLADQAKQAADRGAAVERAVVDAVAAENVKFRRNSRRQNLLLLVMAALLAFTAFNSKSNSDVLKNINQNQAGIDQLVAFVNSVQASQGQGQQATAQAVAEIAQINKTAETTLKVLCSVDDPARKQACESAGVAVTP